MAATIKMDELLVSWIGRDDVYESVMDWIDNYSAAAAAQQQQQQQQQAITAAEATIMSDKAANAHVLSAGSDPSTATALTASTSTGSTPIDKAFKSLSLNDDKENSKLIMTITSTSTDTESETTFDDTAAATSVTSKVGDSGGNTIPSFYPIGQQYPRRRIVRSSSSSSIGSTSVSTASTSTTASSTAGGVGQQPGSSIANPIVTTTTSSYTNRSSRKSRNNVNNGTSTATGTNQAAVPTTTNILSQYDTWDPVPSISIAAGGNDNGKIKKKSSSNASRLHAKTPAASSAAISSLTNHNGVATTTSSADEEDYEDDESKDYNQQLSQSTTINGSTDISDDDDDDDDDDTVREHGLHPSPSSSSPLLTPYPCARDCAQAIYNEILGNFNFHSTVVTTSTTSTSSTAQQRRLVLDQFIRITKDVCRFPSYFNHALYIRIIELWNANIDTMIKDKQPPLDPMTTKVSEQDGITIEMLEWFFRSEMEPYDAYDRFFRLVRQPVNHNFIVRDDFLIFIKSLLSDHPGLEFLSSHSEFQEKYAVTVITRIFYSVNRCHSGRITSRQVRRSDLLEAFTQVDEEDDINKVTRYFSYEHFYVLYCRFWELDHDRDYRITREDLLKYGDHSLSHMIVDRIFDAAPRPFIVEQQQRPIPVATATGTELTTTTNTKSSNYSRDHLSYEDFIYFMLSEEDKSNEVAVRYWFACVDVDGDNKLNNMEMRSFYAVQLHRMQCTGHEIVPFDDMLCQMMDMIKPANTDYLVVEDFLQPECCLVSGALFDALFNLNKYLLFEQRDPFVERQKREDEFDCDWDRFACIDYNRLALEEEAREEEAMDIDWVTVDDEEDEQRQQQAQAQQEANKATSLTGDGYSA